MVTKNAIDSNIPIEIAKGGTNATAMANAFGVNYFDGTRIVTTAVGSATQVLTSNGAGNAPTFQAISGNVTAAANLTDNAVVRGDGGVKGVQTSTVIIDDSGRMTNSSQPAFLALGSNATDVTGDGTAYTIVFGTEIFDQGNNFDGTSTFTAPITGRYLLSAMVIASGFLNTHTVCDFGIHTSNRVYTIRKQPFNNADNNGTGSYQITTIADMDAGDTATVSLTIFNGTKVIDIVGSATAGNTSFSGYLVC